MPDSCEHVKPYVYESAHSKALHFSIFEIQSRMMLDDPYALNLAYTCTMMGFLMFHPAPASLGMIGLGGGSLAKFCWHHLPGTRIEVVEINPHVIALRDEFKIPADDHRFSVIRGDGAAFVRQRGTPLEVLLVDGFDSDGLPQALCSQRFYDDCHAALAPGGVLVANLPREHVHYDALVDRIRRSFNGSTLVVDGGEVSNSVVFARRDASFSLARRSLVKHLDPAAASQLQDAFARVTSALKASHLREPHLHGPATRGPDEALLP